MDATRAKQVRYILDYDNNINKQLVRIEKKQIKRWDDGAEGVMPYMQIEGEVVDAAKQVASDLKILLEKKLTLMFIFDRSVMNQLEPTPELQKNVG